MRRGEQERPRGARSKKLGEESSRTVSERRAGGKRGPAHHRPHPYRAVAYGSAIRGDGARWSVSPAHRRREWSTTCDRPHGCGCIAPQDLHRHRQHRPLPGRSCPPRTARCRARSICRGTDQRRTPPTKSSAGYPKLFYPFEESTSPPSVPKGRAVQPVAPSMESTRARAPSPTEVAGSGRARDGGWDASCAAFAAELAPVEPEKFTSAGAHILRNCRF